MAVPGRCRVPDLLRILAYTLRHSLSRSLRGTAELELERRICDSEWL